MPKPEQPPSVLDLIRHRQATHSLPGHRSADDNYILALAIEGEALRGVVTAGMLIALDDLRLRNTFDLVYISSAGASNAA